MEKEEGGSRAIDVWATLGEDGKISISFLRPVMCQIQLTSRIGVYPKPGEMIWIPGQCREITTHIIGRELEVNVPLRCTLSVVPKDKDD